MLQLFKPKKKTDEELIKKYKSSKNAAPVGELYQRYTHLVFGVCMKYFKNEDRSKDAVMDIFEKLMGDLLKNDINNFQAWLYTYTKNHCLMQLRKKPIEIHDGHQTSQSFMETTVDEHLDEKEDLEIELEQLAKAIDQLKDNQKECIKLFYLEQKSYQQIADSTKMTLNEVKSHIQNGKRNLKNQLKS